MSSNLELQCDKHELVYNQNYLWDINYIFFIDSYPTFHIEGVVGSDLISLTVGM